MPELSFRASLRNLIVAAIVIIVVLATIAIKTMTTTSNIENLEFKITIAELITLGTIAITLISGSFAFYSRSKLNKLQKEQITQLQLDIAQTNERAGKIETQNLELKNNLASLEITLADAKKKQVEAELELQRQLRNVRAIQTPRRLLDKQKELFLSWLQGKAKGKIEIICVAFSPESFNFANEIASALKEAGWPVKDVEKRLFAGEPIGIKLIVRSTDSINPHVNALGRALWSNHP